MYGSNFYHHDWKTKENEKAYDKLESLFFERSHSYPGCPIGWAPEVLELLQRIDKELGIERNTVTINSYHVRNTPFDWFIKDPFLSAYNRFTYIFFTPKNEYEQKYGLRKFSLLKKLAQIVSSFMYPITYGIKAMKVLYINPILNKINRPRFRLDQVKEKFGTLTIYYTAPAAFEQWIDDEIKKTEIKLSLKGAYAPLETLYGRTTTQYVDCEYNPDYYEVEKSVSSYTGKPYIKVTRTTMRRLMKEMDIDLNEVELRFLEKKSKDNKDV